jgi:predicted DNA-binding protein (MmcQ/YjbR family)
VRTPVPSGRPHVFSVSPRVGKSGWVTVVPADVRADELRELVADAWHLTAQSD